MVDLLAHFGKRVDHVGYMYFSPFREEDEPSMKIITRNGKEIWADYGASLSADDLKFGRKVHGGGLLDMAMALAGVDKRGAIEILMEVKPELGVMKETESHQKSTRIDSKESGVVIECISGKFTNRTLVEYARRERCIPLEILQRYCKEIRYHLAGRSSKSFVKIGFANNEGGWTLRGSKGKISSKSGITTFNSTGDQTVEPSSVRAFVFEGFFDFLSWMTWNNSLEPKVDVCVLNSVNNLQRAKKWLQAHTEIAVCFDNDLAGRKAFDILKEMCNGAVVKDCAEIYSEYNDLNDFFVARCRRRNIEFQEPPEPPSKGMKK